MIVFLDRQHSGKPDKRWVSDTGARFDLDGDGAISMWEREGLLTSFVSIYAEARLRELGHKVIPISDGLYYSRHARVNGYARSFPFDDAVYVALHLNAGGGRYGSVFYDHRSLQGAVLGKNICDSLETFADELDSVKTIAAKPVGWTANAFATFAKVGSPVSICYEPCFLDNPEHEPLLSQDGLKRLGLALANGIDVWNKSQS